MQIISDAQLLAQIERFLKKTEISPSRFGREAMGDAALVFQLRKGKRSLSLKNAEKVIAHIQANWPEESAAA